MTHSDYASSLPYCLMKRLSQDYSYVLHQMVPARGHIALGGNCDVHQAVSGQLLYEVVEHPVGGVYRVLARPIQVNGHAYLGLSGVSCEGSSTIAHYLSPRLLESFGSHISAPSGRR